MQFIFCVRFIFIKKGCYRKKMVVAIATNYLFVIFFNEEKSAEKRLFYRYAVRRNNENIFFYFAKSAFKGINRTANYINNALGGFVA